MTAARSFRVLRIQPPLKPNKSHHEQRPVFVHAAEQTIERDAQADENHVTDQIPEDRQSKQYFVRENIFGGRGGIVPNDELARNVKHAERRDEDHRQINKASGACGFHGWMHGFQSFNFQFCFSTSFIDLTESCARLLLPSFDVHAEHQEPQPEQQLADPSARL